MAAGPEFKPKIIGFLCNWCCYGGADLCGVSRFQYPPYLRVIRVMCSGRVDLKFILQSFLEGADGVFVGGCHLNDCHYVTEGNYDALSMSKLCNFLLEHTGINPKRFRLEWVSAGEGSRFASIMNEFSMSIKQQGPLGTSEGIDKNKIKSRLKELIKLIPYIKLMKKSKLGLHSHDNEQAYEELYTRDEIERLLLNVPSYYIDPDKCRSCMICARMCPVNAIEGSKNLVHRIDKSKCIKCGACIEACPPKFNAVKMISEMP